MRANVVELARPLPTTANVISNTIQLSDLRQKIITAIVRHVIARRMVKMRKSVA